MESKNALKLIAVLILGVFIGAFIAAAAVSSATGLSFEDIFIRLVGDNK